MEGRRPIFSISQMDKKFMGINIIIPIKPKYLKRGSMGNLSIREKETDARPSHPLEFMIAAIENKPSIRKREDSLLVRMSSISTRRSGLRISPDF